MADGRTSIDGRRDAGGALGREALLEILPYGEEFLFVDRVSHLDAERIEASYRVPRESWFLAAHFREFPIMPGALIAEGVGQVGSLLVRYGLADADASDVVGIEIEGARLSHPAFPGDILTYRCQLLRGGRRAARIAGEVAIGARQIAAMRLTLGVVERARFRSRGS